MGCRRATACPTAGKHLRDKHERPQRKKQGRGGGTNHAERTRTRTRNWKSIRTRQAQEQTGHKHDASILTTGNQANAFFFPRAISAGKRGLFSGVESPTPPSVALSQRLEPRGAHLPAPHSFRSKLEDRVRKAENTSPLLIARARSAVAARKFRGKRRTKLTVTAVGVAASFENTPRPPEGENGAAQKRFALKGNTSANEGFVRALGRRRRWCIKNFSRGQPDRRSERTRKEQNERQKKRTKKKGGISD